MYSPNFLRRKSRKSAVYKLMKKQKAREAREELEEVEVDEDGNEIKEEGNDLYVNPEDVSVNMKAKMSKEERLELVKVNASTSTHVPSILIFYHTPLFHPTESA